VRGGGPRVRHGHHRCGTGASLCRNVLCVRTCAFSFQFFALYELTWQLVSLAQLLLDPYARTLAGFRALVVREWIAMGHPFATRADINMADTTALRGSGGRVPQRSQRALVFLLVRGPPHVTFLSLVPRFTGSLHSAM
jgi:hypothetical protein